MTPEEVERMNRLCLDIQQERNLEKFESLLRDLTELVAQKERRLAVQNANVTRDARVEKTLAAIARHVIKPFASEPERVEISIPEAADLYREIRIENTFLDRQGRRVALSPGTAVDVTFKADATKTVPKAANP